MNGQSEAENRYRRLVELSPDLVLLCDGEGRIRYVNLAGLEVLGFDEHGQLVGRRLEEIVHPDSRSRIGARLRALFDGSSDDGLVEGLFLRADGSTISAEMMGYLFLDGGEYAAHLVVRDVTRRKQAEAAARRARRKLAATVSAAGLAVAAAASFHVYRYTESVGFCGTVCHSAMGPEYTLHRRSPHAHVTCAQCHIGHGAGWYVKTKLSGLYQVYAVATGSFPKPIPAPIENLRPASETCEHCHSREVFHGNRTKVFRRVPEDGSAADPEVSAVALRLGGYRNGAFSGIHWHAGMVDGVEYRAADRRRLRIAELRVTRGGAVTTYTDKGAPLPAGTPWRRMDCPDCHNRTPHRYRTAEESVDELLLAGRLRPNLPGLKKAALTALRIRYPSREQAQAGIRASLAAFYHRRGQDLARLADTLYREAYAPNVYPELGIGWNSYPEHIGHREDLGCFRCHDGAHKNAEGQALAQDCRTCHAILVNGSRQSELEPKVRDLLF